MRDRLSPFRMAAAIALISATPLAAQSALPCAALGAGAADSTIGEPTVRIVASAAARELRFDSRPELRLDLGGCAGRDSSIVTERRNLPTPVQPGVTYRDVSIGVDIRSYLRVQCLLPALADSAVATRARDLADLCGAVPPTRPAATAP